jgi:hypothetical protein
VGSCQPLSNVLRSPSGPRVCNHHRFHSCSSQVPDIDRDLAFCITHKDRNYFFQATSTKDLYEWYNVLRYGQGPFLPLPLYLVLTRKPS